MGYIVDEEKGLETVGELIKSLQRFPEDMPIRVVSHDAAEVYKVTPQEDEDVLDERGRICIDGDY